MQNESLETGTEPLPVFPILLWAVLMQIIMGIFMSGMIWMPDIEFIWKIFYGTLLALLVPISLYFNCWILPNKDRREHYVKQHAKHGLFQQDIAVWVFFQKHPGLLVILLLASIAAGISLPFSFAAGIALLPFTNIFLVIASVFVASFICCSIYIFGYLLVAEYVQRHVLMQHRPFIVKDLIMDYIHAFPLLILMSILWTLFALVSSVSKKRKGILASIYMMILVLKYYTFSNLAFVAIHEARGWLSYRDAAQQFQTNTQEFFMIWFRKGALLLPIFLFSSLGLWAWAKILPQWGSIFSIGAFLCASILLLSELIMEQIAFLLYFIEKKFSAVPQKVS